MKRNSLLNRLIGHFLWKIGKFQYKLKLINDNPKPDEIKDNIVYVVGGRDYVKWAYLKCPDKCGENILLNLSANRKPSWTVEQDNKGRITVHPSIHKLEGCKCHFWIRKGAIIWS